MKIFWKNQLFIYIHLFIKKKCVKSQKIMKNCLLFYPKYKTLTKSQFKNQQKLICQTL